MARYQIGEEARSCYDPSQESDQMGHGYTIRCKCRGGKQRAIFLGTGMGYPITCREIWSKMRNGDFGSRWKDYLEKNPNGLLDCEKAIYRCPVCNFWTVDCKMSYYLPQEGVEKAESYYHDYSKGRSQYRCVKRFAHECPACGKRMHIVKDPRKEPLLCTKCGGRIEIEDSSLLWD